MDRPRAGASGFGLRAVLVFAGLVGVVYGDPLPLDWTGLPALLRTGERLVGMAPPASVNVPYAPSGLMSPLYLGLVTLSAALLWTAVDRTRPREAALGRLVPIVVRYVLAVELLRRGLGEVLGMEVTIPDVPDWVRPWGQFGGCDVARVWLGYPPTYTLYLGTVEIAGGLLLLARRTTSLGAMVVAGLLLNVTVLGLAYCPVLVGYACTFGALAVSLLAMDRRRLVEFLWRGRLPSPLLHWEHRQPSPAFRRTIVALQLVVLTLAAATHGSEHIRSRADRRPLSPLRGVYRVDDFTRNGKAEPWDARIPARWRTVAVGRFADRIGIWAVDGSYLSLRLVPRGQPGQPPAGIMAPACPRGALDVVADGSGGAIGSAFSGALAFECEDPGRLIISGRVSGAEVSATLRWLGREPPSTWWWPERG